MYSEAVRREQRASGIQIAAWISSTTSRIDTTSVTTFPASVEPTNAASAADGVSVAPCLVVTDGQVDIAENSFQEQIGALIGKAVGSGAPSIAPDPVNQPMIRHWAAAFDDRNPVYTDAEFAAATGFGEVVAPPMMLQTWTMATPLITGIGERGGAPTASAGTSPLTVFDEAGFVATLAANSEFEIERYLRLGEVITSSTVIESISPEKQTRVGPGHFVTWITTYATADGEVVGRQRFRILKFKPGGQPSTSSTTAQP